MASDVKLDEGHEGWVVIEGSVLRSRTADLMLDSPTRRSAAGGPHRRALVHDPQDGLTVNFAGDYPAGVTIVNAHVNLAVVHQEGGEPQLPRSGNVGDLLMLVNTRSLDGVPIGTQTSLWLCVPNTGLHAMWQQIQLTAPVAGTI
jgi:hypothetical protein